MAALALARKPLARQGGTAAQVPASVQRKLEVGGASDHFEREADQVARRAVQGGGPVAIPPTISPLSAQCKPMSANSRKAPEEKKPAKVQRKAAGKTPKVEEDKKSGGPKAQRKAAASTKPAKTDETKKGGAKAQRKAASASPKKQEEKPAKGKAQRKASAKTPKVDEDKKAGGKQAQRKKIATPPEREEKAGTKKTQRKAQRDDGGAGSAGGVAPGAVESSIGRMQSVGSGGLDSSTRSFMESRIGHDFSGVRVHRGSEAAAAADALNARAFTVGNDIFFNRGEYQPHSQGGRELLAHELTHTVQQAGRAARKIQRVPTPAPAPSTPAKEALPPNHVLNFTTTEAGTSRQGSLELDTNVLNLPVLRLPTLNGTVKGGKDGTEAGGRPKSIRSGQNTFATGEGWWIQAVGPRPPGSAASKWVADGREKWSAALKTKLEAKLRPDSQKFEGDIYMLGFTRRSQARDAYFLFGTLEDISRSQILLIPNWTRQNSEPNGPPPRGGPSLGFFDVDHILEWQLGGADDTDNMWLLQSSFNQRTGSTISSQINSDIAGAVRVVREHYDVSGVTIPNTDAIRASWRINFATTISTGDNAAVPFWTRDNIRDGLQLEPMKFLTGAEIGQRGLHPVLAGRRPTEVDLFPTENGGSVRKLGISSGRLRAPPNPEIYRNMFFLDGVYQDDGQNIGAVRIEFWKNLKNDKGQIIYRGNEAVKEPVIREVHISKIEPFINVGYFSKADVYAASENLNIAGLSPLGLTRLELDSEGNLIADGSLTATKALFPNLGINLSIVNDEIRLSFPIPIAGFNLGPFSITSLAMSLGYGPRGPSIEGMAGFEIRGVGTGSITASAATRGGPTIAGRFDLETDFLNPAFVDVSYNFGNDELTATGSLGVQSGRIPGVQSGQVTVNITRQSVGITGTINLAAPLAGTVVNVGYTPERGIVIGAENIPLPFGNLPAVQNATMSIGAARSPEGVWSFTGAGTATLAIPGATGTINLAYADGLVTMTTVATVQKGPATGTLNFTATNGAVDEQGNPIEGQIGNGITAWGRGRVTIQFGQFVQGTADIEYTRDNSIILRGEIALPPVYEVFARREYNRELLHLEPPEFPIWGVSVAGIGIGIFAFVDARVSFNAYVGPGQIRDAAISAEMDLDHPENATVHGHGQFYVPAYAGLNLDVGGGLRARAAVAYVQGRVGLEGQLGLEASASASIDINWNRAEGISLETQFDASIRPKFRLLANASVTVGVDLLFTDVSHTFGPWEKTLGEFGPDMELGVSFPIRWSEANGLDLSLDNMTVRQPTLDAGDLMSSVFDRLAS